MTKLTNTTPGPWTYDRVAGEVYGPKSTDEVVVVYSGGLQFPSDGHLIAAAPELYEALKEATQSLEIAVRYAGGDPETHFVSQAARAALAKARGEQ